MPVYNGQKYIREAIDSILGQTLKAFEFIIINDGSTDDSVRIIRSYIDPRIRLINNENNIGLIKTLNRGLELAKGEYLARMDCDDVSLPYRLEKQVDYLNKNPDIDTCGTWFTSFGRKRKKVGKTEERDEFIRSHLIFNPSICHPTVMFSLNSLRNYRLCYDEKYVHAEDYALWVRAMNFLKFANIQEVLYLYRIHPDSVSCSHSIIQERTANSIRKELLKKMNVNFSNKELQLHNDISNQNITYTRGFIWETANWLTKLHQTNLKTNFFPEPAFSEIIAKRWYRLCRSSQRIGFWTWKTFWNCSLSSFVAFPLKNRIGFTIKCILHIK